MFDYAKKIAMFVVMKKQDMIEITFDDRILRAAPGLRVITIEADVTNKATSEALWNEIRTAEKWVKDNFAIEEIRHRPAIAGTRDAYKALGKEPNRYRPSAEALCRRAVKGMELYRTLTIIDLINLISMRSGYSIGGFDADKIEGDGICLGAGLPGEPYDAIGRGPLNIENLPVFRDNVGGIGTPTSDNERTKLEESTRHVLMTVNIYREGEMDDDTFVKWTCGLLEKYALAKNIKFMTWNTVI